MEIYWGPIQYMLYQEIRSCNISRPPNLWGPLEVRRLCHSDVECVDFGGVCMTEPDNPQADSV